VIAYEKFEAWKVSHDLALEVYRVSDSWPSGERYQLTAQVRRAAVSIPANIAEGAAKRGPREFRRYLEVANGSLAELSYLLRLCRDLGIMKPQDFQNLEPKRDYAGKLTFGLYSSLAASRQR
jgi:four helix bundle protein